MPSSSQNVGRGLAHAVFFALTIFVPQIVGNDAPVVPFFRSLRGSRILRSKRRRDC